MKSPMSRNDCARVLFVLASLGLLLLAGGCQQATMSNAVYQTTGTPKLVELGTAACIPCALMKPGLDELRAQYAGRLDVEVIDVMLNPSAKTQYNAPFCATQIYIAASGRELYRHVGYVSKQEILANWKQFGVDLDAPARQQ